MYIHHINLLAVLIAVIANMVLGSLWYSKLLFGKAWMAGIGKTEEEIKKGNTGMAYGAATIGAIIVAFVLSHLILNVAWVDMNNPIAIKVMSGMKVATYCWLGFVVPINLAETFFEGKSKIVSIINAFFHLVEFNVMAFIIVSMN